MIAEWLTLKQEISSGDSDRSNWSELIGKCELVMIRDGMKPDMDTIACGMDVLGAIPWEQLGSGMQRTRIRLLLRIGRVAEKLGQWTRAYTCFDSACAFALTHDEPRLQAIALMEKGELLRHMGKLDQSVACQEQAIALAQREGLLVEQADASNNLANSLTEMGDIDRAQDCFACSLEIAERLQEPRIEGHVYNNQGVIRCIQGTFREAIAEFTRAVTKREQASDTRGIAETYHNMSMAFKDLGDLPRAEEYIQTALEYGASVVNEGLITNMLLTSLDITILKKDYNYAGILAQLIETKQKVLEDKPGYAETQKLKGLISLGLHEWVEAMDHFSRALELFSGMKLVHGEAETLELMAECKSWSGEKESAIEYRKRAAELYAKLGNHEKARQLISN